MIVGADGSYTYTVNKPDQSAADAVLSFSLSSPYSFVDAGDTSSTSNYDTVIVTYTVTAIRWTR